MNSSKTMYRAPGRNLRRRGQALLEYVLMLGLVSIMTSLITNFFLIKVWDKALGPGSSSLWQQLISLMSMG